MPRGARFCVFLLAGCLFCQVPGGEAAAVTKLGSSLAALSDTSVTTAVHLDRISGDLMALAEEQHRPSGIAVAFLAVRLVGALSGKRLSEPRLSQLATGILDVLHSAGTGTYKLRESISRVEGLLLASGVQAAAAKKVSAELAVVGREVRGPEDVPLDLP